MPKPSLKTRLKRWWNYSQLSRRGRSAVEYARARNTPGMIFDDFGRALGRSIAAKDYDWGLSLAATPVNIVRYFEFDFVARHLPAPTDGSRWLDVSSPRLFSMWASRTFPQASVRFANPDPADANATKYLASCAGIDRLSIDGAEVAALRGSGPYQAIWSISVIEHIDGAYTDADAMRWLYNELAPGGRLLVTLPVDRVYREDFRPVDHYNGVQHVNEKGEIFFARFYDLAHLQRRVLDAMPKPPDAIEFWGEKVAGRYAAYEKRWIRDGLRCTVDDAREIADHYQSYPDWASMPGSGIVGLRYDKPA